MYEIRKRLSITMNEKIFKKNILDSLSIIVHGALNKDNILRTAQILSGWKKLFGSCKIVFSISYTDIVVSENCGIAFSLRLVKKYEDDGRIRNALEVIKNSCSIIVFSDPAVTLPPVKIDSEENDCNLKINSVNSGLRVVDTEYVLVIKNDMIFTDDEFVDFYIKNISVPRKNYAALKQRVLISDFFTINPYTFEALPFHYSDWFHFGLTEDVRNLWDVAPYDVADSTYYEINPHRKNSNHQEKKFISRYATAQYLSFTVFKKYFPKIELEFHNDITSIDESINILADNFLISDHKYVKYYFPHCKNIMNDQLLKYFCISFDLWDKIVKKPKLIDYKFLFHSEIRVAKRIHSEEERQKEQNRKNNQEIVHSQNASKMDVLHKNRAFTLFLLAILGKRKRKKLIEDPHAFFRDSKSAFTRYMGREYLK